MRELLVHPTRNIDATMRSERTDELMIFDGFIYIYHL